MNDKIEVTPDEVEFKAPKIDELSKDDVVFDEPVAEGTEPRLYSTLKVEREAICWTGRNADEVKAFVGTVDEGYNKNQEVFSYDPDNGATIGRLYVAANREWLALDIGEWIIKDSEGFYPCKNNVFHEKYEPVKQSPNDGVSFHDVDNAFSNADKTIISWEGANYYQACDAPVDVDADGAGSHCLKRTGHPTEIHEDWDGRIAGPEVTHAEGEPIDLPSDNDVNLRVLALCKELSYSGTREIMQKMAKHGFEFNG